MKLLYRGGWFLFLDEVIFVGDAMSDYQAASENSIEIYEYFLYDGRRHAYYILADAFRVNSL